MATVSFNNCFTTMEKENKAATPIPISPSSTKGADEKTTTGRFVVNPDDSRSPRGGLRRSSASTGRMSRLDMFLNSPDRQSAVSPPTSPPTATSSEEQTSPVLQKTPEAGDAPPQRKIVRAKRSKNNLLKEEPAKDAGAEAH